MKKVSEKKDGMNILWNEEIRMDDEAVLRADIFMPEKEGKYPVIISYGPYAKGLAFQEGYPESWKIMCEENPSVPSGSSNKYANWEVCDPEKWVKDGYVIIRVDSRGCGCSPGYVDCFSERETKDFCQCIEWAAVQPFSNGKVGLNGISYYGMNQWQVASMQPPHLKAMCIWEGASDWYRDCTHHGGIVTTFWANWYDKQVTGVQYGLGERGKKSRVTGENISGDEMFSDTELAANRCFFGDMILGHPLDDEYHRERSADFSKIKVPLLSAGNWGGQGLHLRGNVEGYLLSGSKEKFLELHGLAHWVHFYTDYGVDLQKKFFAHYLKGENNGFDSRKPVQLQVRHLDHFEERFEDAWPIPRTKWTKYYLDPSGNRLTLSKPSGNTKISYDTMGEGVCFISDPLEEETEITGPSAAKLKISSETTDADIFVVVKAYSSDMREVTFQGAIDPHTPISQGWLRASQRKLDEKRSEPYRPYHTHDEEQPLKPGVPYSVDVEVWPASVVLPKGYRFAVSIRGNDYVANASGEGETLTQFKNKLTGCGPFLHNEPRDRKPEVFGSAVTLHFDEDKPYILLPIIPKK